MDFPSFAKKTKPIIGGNINSSNYARLLFEKILIEDGILKIENLSDDSFKSYFNGKVSISSISTRCLPYVDASIFSSYLDEFSDATIQRLCDDFSNDINDINPYNASEKIACLFEDIIKTAATKTKKSTKPSAKKKPSSNETLKEKMLASGQTVADIFTNVVSNLTNDATEEEFNNSSSNSIPNIEFLNKKDLLFLDKFRIDSKNILQYCIKNDPSAGPTSLSLSDEIDALLSKWEFEIIEIKDSSLRKIISGVLDIINNYSYYLTEKFLYVIPDGSKLCFRCNTQEERTQLKEVLQPETYNLRCQMRDVYIQLFSENYSKLDEESYDSSKIVLPKEHTSSKSAYSSLDNDLLDEFSKDYDGIMLKLISENYIDSLIDMSLPQKIHQLFKEKWSTKANDFTDPTLKSHVFNLLGELNKISDVFLAGNYSAPFLKATRTKIRNLFVKLHPNSYSVSFPFDAFIDDWNDGEF